ncbi:MAG: sigma-70 family RNA polymerase sigma factor [Eubacterium sp.]|nr:sigma-70 family RNA polymerase sigma factor [Eubacterium sp.]
MYCRYCGEKNDDNVNFCMNCGKKLKDELSELGEKFKNGDENAFEQIYRKSEGWVKNYVYQRLASADVDDCMQQIYVKIFEHIDSYKGGNFRAWMNTIVKNTVIDYVRVNKKYTENDVSLFSGEDDAPLELESKDYESMPEEVIDQEETARLVRELIEELGEKHRTCLTLFYLEDMSISEIANLYGISEGTVKSRLNAGRKKLEDKVLALEKKGTKLYGLAPIPLFVWLLKSQTTAKASVNMGIYHSVMAQVHAQTVAGASTAIGSAVAKTAASAGSKVAVKVVCGIVAAGVVAGGAAGVVHHKHQTEQVQTEVAVEDEETEAETSSVEETKSPEEEFYSSLPEEYIFTSGAGGWDTRLWIEDDGSFTGYYYDTNLSSENPDEYEYTVYYCKFSGIFTNLTQVDEYTYSANVEDLTYDTPDKRTVENKVEYITAGAHGLDEAKNVEFYLPGKPVSELSDMFMGWASSMHTTGESESIEYYGIYNIEEQEAFTSEEPVEVDTSKSGITEDLYDIYYDTFIEDGDDMSVYISKMEDMITVEESSYEDYTYDFAPEYGFDLLKYYSEYDLGTLYYHYKQIEDVTLAGLYPGMDMESVEETLKGYGFKKESTDGDTVFYFKRLENLDERQGLSIKVTQEHILETVLTIELEAAV